MTSPVDQCPACGAPLDAKRFSGICPACLLLGAADEAPTGSSLGKLGGYELIEVIARGGMGVVYRARQNNPARQVALKALPGAELMSDEARQRFRIEAQAMRKLEHPAILPIYELGEEDETPFFTMKLAEGGSLAQRIAIYEGKCREIGELIAKVADAVQFAHEHGVLHRDLKPGNILFDEEGNPFVSDFGLAKMMDEKSDLTRTIGLMGTPNYLAPELTRGGKGAATTGSDVWALGVMLYELLCGHPPFHGGNLAMVLRQLNEESAPPLPNDVPRDLAIITFKALQKAPAQRYSTANDLADDLRRWLRGEAILARPTPLLERALLWSRHNPSLAGMAAVLMVVLVVSSILLLRNNEHLRIVDKQRRAEIHGALVSQADAERHSIDMGRRARAITLVKKALEHGTSARARSVVASSLAVTDVITEAAWSPEVRLEEWASTRFTPDLSMHIARVPAGQLKESSWKDGAEGLWRTADHQLLKQIPLRKHEDYSPALLSADGRWRCLRVNKRALEIWSWETESLLKTIQSTRGISAAFHPAANAVIACVNESLVRISLPECEVRPIIRIGGSSSKMSVSRDGSKVVLNVFTAPTDSSPTEHLEIRSLKDGALLNRADTKIYGDLAWNPDGEQVAAFDYDSGELKLYSASASGGFPKLLLKSVSTGRRVAFHPDGRTIVWSDNGGYLHFWDLWLSRSTLRIPGTAGNLMIADDGHALMFQPDNQRIAIARVEASDVFLQSRVTEGDRSVDRHLSVSHDGRWIVTGDLLGISLWRAEDMVHVWHGLAYKTRTPVSDLSFSGDSKHVRFESVAMRRTVWNLVDNPDGTARLADPNGSRVPSEHLLVGTSENGRWECTQPAQGDLGSLNLWRDGQMVANVKRQRHPYRFHNASTVISPDGKWRAVFANAAENTPKPGLSYVSSFEIDNDMHVLTEAASHVYPAISPDGRWLVGGENGDYVVWEAGNWREVFRLPAELSSILMGSATFSPDGRWLALEVEHGKIRFLHTGTWDEWLTLTQPHDLPIVRMIFSPDGRFLYHTGGQLLSRWDMREIERHLKKMGL